MWANIWIPLIILVFSLLLSSFFCASEIVYSSVNKLRLNKEAKSGNIRASNALKVASNFNKYSAALLFGNGLTNIASSSMATLIALELFQASYGEETSVLIASAFIFIIVVVFAELTPKFIGRRYAYPLSLFFYPAVIFFRHLFFPVVFVVSKAVNLLSRLWKKHETDKPVSEEELVEMVDTIEKGGFIDQKQGQLLRSAIEFGDIDAFEVMTPRVDVFSFNIEDDVSELLENPDTFTYSRVPVYEGTIDKIIGILPTKRLYPFLLNPQKVDVRSLLITPLFVIHGQTISSILKLFKDTHQHIAIVIDEYGGTEGIITLEDILEEIVGEIWDENDEVTLKVIQPSSNVYIIDGSLQIEDFFSLVSWRGEVESDYSTLGGWCQEKLGRFGRQGDSFIFHHLKFIVLQADEFTIEKIRVEIENHSS